MSSCQDTVLQDAPVTFVAPLSHDSPESLSVSKASSVAANDFCFSISTTKAQYISHLPCWLIVHTQSLRNPFLLLCMS